LKLLYNCPFFFPLHLGFFYHFWLRGRLAFPPPPPSIRALVGTFRSGLLRFADPFPYSFMDMLFFLMAPQVLLKKLLTTLPFFLLFSCRRFFTPSDASTSSYQKDSSTAVSSSQPENTLYPPLCNHPYTCFFFFGLFFSFSCAHPLSQDVFRISRNLSHRPACPPGQHFFAFVAGPF